MRRRVEEPFQAFPARRFALRGSLRAQVVHVHGEQRARMARKRGACGLIGWRSRGLWCRRPERPRRIESSHRFRLWRNSLCGPSASPTNRRLITCFRPGASPKKGILQRRGTTPAAQRYARASTVVAACAKPAHFRQRWSDRIAARRVVRTSTLTRVSAISSGSRVWNAPCSPADGENPAGSGPLQDPTGQSPPPEPGFERHAAPAMSATVTTPARDREPSSSRRPRRFRDRRARRIASIQPTKPARRGRTAVRCGSGPDA